MHKNFTILIFALLLSSGLYAQQPACVPFAITADTSIILPEPYNFDDMTGGLDSTCVGSFYEQVLTTLVPQSINYNGTDFSIDSIAIDQMGAIENLPAGLDYACNPPNCVFLPDSVACFVVSGTTDAAVVPQTYNLVLKIRVYNFIFPNGTVITYPDDLGNENESYFIDVASAEDCTVNTRDEFLNTHLQWTIAPNPATNFVQLNINSLEDLDLQLSITDILGAVHFQTKVAVQNGHNQVDLDLLDLSQGLYFVNLTNGQEFITQKLVIEE